MRRDFGAAIGDENLRRYQRIAPVYDLLDLPFELRRYRALRPLLFEGLGGRLLDAGVGTGRNFPFYPMGARVVGIDLSLAMLARARRRLPEATAAVELAQMDIASLAFPDDSFDACVASFLFCVLTDDQQVAALNEIARVVRQGGIVRLLEYVRPTGTLRRTVSRLWQPWIAWAYGASFDRQTEMHIRSTKLETVESRFVVTDLVKIITARRPVA